MADKNIKWLLNELTSWSNEGLVDVSTADRIRKYYESQPSLRKKWALVAFSILGSLLIGAGVILLLAHNWTDLSLSQRSVLSFAPLVISQCLAGWVLLKRRDGAAWREGAGIAVTLSIGACIALVSQTYHIPGSFDQFMLIWMLLALPVIYLLNSSVSAAIYLAGIISWAGYVQFHHGQVPIVWLLIAAIVPHLWLSIRRNRYDVRSSFLLWAFCIGLCIVTGIALEKNLPGLWIPVYASLFASMYLAGRLYFNEVPSFWQRPLVIVGSWGTVVLSWMLTFNWPWKDIGWRFYRERWGYFENAAIADYCLLSILLILSAVLIARAIAGQERSGLFFGALPAVTVVGYAVTAAYRYDTLAVVLMNAFFVCAGVGLIGSGVKSTKLSRLNGGMLIVGVFIVSRFFDTDFDMFVRGIIFIALGAMFLVANVVMIRKKGRA